MYLFCVDVCAKRAFKVVPYPPGIAGDGQAILAVVDGLVEEGLGDVVEHALQQEDSQGRVPVACFVIPREVGQEEEQEGGEDGGWGPAAADPRSALDPQQERGAVLQVVKFMRVRELVRERTWARQILLALWVSPSLGVSRERHVGFLEGGREEEAEEEEEVRSWLESLCDDDDDDDGDRVEPDGGEHQQLLPSPPEERRSVRSPCCSTSVFLLVLGVLVVVLSTVLFRLLQDDQPSTS